MSKYDCLFHAFMAHYVYGNRNIRQRGHFTLFFFFFFSALATSSGSFSGEAVFRTRTMPVKPVLSAPEGASGPLPSVASPEKIPYFRDQLLTGKTGAPIRSIGLATINYQLLRAQQVHPSSFYPLLSIGLTFHSIVTRHILKQTTEIFYCVACDVAVLYCNKCKYI